MHAAEWEERRSLDKSSDSRQFVRNVNPGTIRTDRLDRITMVETIGVDTRSERLTKRRPLISNLALHGGACPVSDGAVGMMKKGDLWSFGRGDGCFNRDDSIETNRSDRFE